MSINTSTTSVNSTSSAASVSTASSSEVSSKTSTESSFKEEMEKVTSSEKQDNEEVTNVSEETTKDLSKESVSDDEIVKIQDDGNNLEDQKLASLAMLDMNSQLSNDIQKMMTTNKNENLLTTFGVDKMSSNLTLDFSPSNITMSKADAEFFVNLTKNNDVSAQNIINQAQSLLNNGAEASQVKQSSQISQTLLNALITAKENNQPLRIDFDQNISVILRVGKDGALAANFIPGDKAVEQYLRNNIESLKNTFKENDLPYSDLSYSNRGSKQQKENRRNKQ